MTSEEKSGAGAAEKDPAGSADDELPRYMIEVWEGESLHKATSITLGDGITFWIGELEFQVYPEQGDAMRKFISRATTRRRRAK